jgi:hypothetical protein
VGIGTSSPTLYGVSGRSLTVSTTSGYSFLQLQGPSNAGGAIDFGNDTVRHAEIASLTGSALAFYTNATNSGNALTERMRIDSGGKVCIGKTAYANTTVGFAVDPIGAVNCVLASSANTGTTWETYSTGAGAFRFYVGMAGTVFATNTTISAISDIRHKENVRDLDVGLNEILSLKPRKFDWKEGKGKDIKDDRGFIAQEFAQVFPDLIDEWKDPAPEGEEPYKSVRQDLIPVLVKAIQEQQTIIESLKSRLDAAGL